jgi:DNA-binding response OmpR family regulator
MTMSAQLLAGLNVLLVEDEFLIAVDAEDMLKNLHAAKVSVVSTYEDAERTLQEHTFDVAVLDVNLNGKMSFPLGEILRQRGVPFVFASGYNLGSHVDGFRDGHWVSKPYQLDQLRAGLVEALKTAEGRPPS